MLNREEYNATFHVDLSEEEFERVKPIVLGGDNIKDIESITAVIPNTLERIEFLQIVRCENCKYCIKEDDYEHWCDGWGRPMRLVNVNDFCSHGKEQNDEQKLD